jgi:hypothetical protein
MNVTWHFDTSLGPIRLGSVVIDMIGLSTLGPINDRPVLCVFIILGLCWVINC